MPVLDAKALKTDPEGLAFLRDVLRSGKSAQVAAPNDQPSPTPKKTAKRIRPSQAERSPVL